MLQLPKPDPKIVEGLRTLRGICLVLAVAVGLYAVLTWFLVEGFQLSPKGMPEVVPVSLTFLAMVLILLSSRLRTSILRGALRSGLRSSQLLGVNLDTLIAAYRRATLVSFLILEFAALLGLLIGLLSGIAFYGIFLCAASLFAMVTRWPRPEEVDRLARGRATP